jgi:hypothetical protein
MGRRGREASVELEQSWRVRVREQASSGQSVAAYCASEELSAASFYAWRRTLAERDRLRRSAGRPQFVPVRVKTEASESSALDVVLGGGRVVRVGPGFDATLLRAVVAALEAAPC